MWIMKFLSILLFIIPSITLCQENYEQSETLKKSWWDLNLPKALSDFYQGNIRSTYAINTSLNPFYLRGDFDGDKIMDYALAVIEGKTNKKGILIYHPRTKKYFLAGAGTAIPNGQDDDYLWMSVWQVYDKKNIGTGVDQTAIAKLKGEAILVEQLESSSGLIYWTGKEYVWYQQRD